MKTQFNQSNAMFTYDGDYSFLHDKDENNLAEQNNNQIKKNTPSTPLMWLKVPGYKQKNVQTKRVAYQDLMWLKINGYKQKNKMDLAISRIPSEIQPLVTVTAFDNMKLLEANYKFYLGAMSLMILLNLFVVFSFFNHS